MSYIPTPEQALELTKRYNKEAFHIQHAETVGKVMRYLAGKYDAGNEDYWQAVGILHDIDFEQWPEEHCKRADTLLRELDIDESVIHAVVSHGWGMTGADAKPEHPMEQVLFAVDELTGLIGAAALMRPSKSVQDMELSSLKKKYKDKKFAAGCSRQTIAQGAEALGWELPELLERTLQAMKACEADIEAKCASL